MTHEIDNSPEGLEFRRVNRGRRLTEHLFRNFCCTCHAPIETEFQRRYSTACLCDSCVTKGTKTQDILGRKITVPDERKL